MRAYLINYIPQSNLVTPSQGNTRVEYSTVPTLEYRFRSLPALPRVQFHIYLMLSYRRMYIQTIIVHRVQNLPRISSLPRGFKIANGHMISEKKEKKTRSSLTHYDILEDIYISLYQLKLPDQLSLFS